ncbi:hypothetical protein BGZ81_008639 [Podila clonocystis]|nr:hypothetical protein BGZ81_008639 [Podila clonocystis]
MKTLTDREFKSPMYLEDDSLHSKLETDFSLHYGKECVLTQSGYTANAGLMHAICEPGMNAYVDKYTHASFLDGLRSMDANIHVSSHNDIAKMESNIIKHGPGIIIVDTLYSNNGSFAPIEKILQLKNAYNCMMVVDESHSLGMYGKHGYLHMLGVDMEVDYITASLAKAFCTRAGVIMGGNAIFIKENCSSYIFSSALTGVDIVRLQSMFEVIKGADDRRERLMVAAHNLRYGQDEYTFADIMLGVGFR